MGVLPRHVVFRTGRPSHRDVLPAGYIALEQVSQGASIEIDVGTYAEEAVERSAGHNGGTATLPRTVWTPATLP